MRGYQRCLYGRRSFQLAGLLSVKSLIPSGHLKQSRSCLCFTGFRICAPSAIRPLKGVRSRHGGELLVPCLNSLKHRRRLCSGAEQDLFMRLGTSEISLQLWGSRRSRRITWRTECRVHSVTHELGYNKSLMLELIHNVLLGGAHCAG